MKVNLSLITMACVLGLAVHAAQAGTITWNNGASGNWGDSANWDSSSVPVINGATPDVVNIFSGAVTYTGTSGDWANNTTVTVNGPTASWTQTSGNWLKIGDGTGNAGVLNVINGASFDISAAGNTFVGNGGTGVLNVDGGTFHANTLNVSSGSSVSVSNNGMLTATSNLLNSGIVEIQGGQVSVANEFKFQAAGLQGTMNGGTLTAKLLSFIGDGTTEFDFLAGNITLTEGTFFDGIYSTGGYINFSSTSTGTIDLLGGATEANALALISNAARVRVDGQVSPSSFVITTIANGVEISLANVTIPEPASLTLLGAGMVALLARRRKV